MNSFMYVLAVCVVAVVGSPIEDGSWNPYRYGNTGKYIPTDEGRYIHIPNPYIHDNNPYNHDDNPYNHDDNPYIHEYESNVQATEANKLEYIPPKKDLLTYKEGCYRNYGTKIINQNHQYAENQYNFNFENENRIRAGENAVLKNPNSIDEGIASSGFYEYIGPDGFMYRVDYTADENGFRPKVKRIETPYSGKWVLEKNN